MRTVFMGSPGLAVPCLEALVLNGYRVVAVYTPPDRPAGRGRETAAPPVKEAALRLGLTVVQPESFKTSGAVAQLAEYRPEIIVVCAYGQILPPAVLDMPPRRCINVHFSLLPRHRGASPVAAAILAGDEFTGVSIMVVEPRLDTGPVLAAAAVPIGARDNTGSLTDKLAAVGAGLLLEAMSGWGRGEITPRPQDEAGADYFPQVKKEDGKIDWNLPALAIWRRVRAFYPWPGAYTAWQGRQLKIIEAAVLSAPPTTEIGRVVALGGREEAFGIGTSEGVLGVLRVQLEGKRAISSAEFLRGQRDFIGAVLPG